MPVIPILLSLFVAGLVYSTRKTTAPQTNGAVPPPEGFEAYFYLGPEVGAGKAYVSLDNLGPGNGASKPPYVNVGYTGELPLEWLSQDGKTAIVRWSSAFDPRIPLADQALVIAQAVPAKLPAATTEAPTASTALTQKAETSVGAGGTMRRTSIATLQCRERCWVRPEPRYWDDEKWGRLGFTAPKGFKVEVTGRGPTGWVHVQVMHPEQGLTDGWMEERFLEPRSVSSSSGKSMADRVKPTSVLAKRAERGGSPNWSGSGYSDGDLVPLPKRVKRAKPSLASLVAAAKARPS